jgi:hypothetical protein
MLKVSTTALEGLVKKGGEGSDKFYRHSFLKGEPLTIIFKGGQK